MATILALDKDAFHLNLLGFLLRDQGHKVYVTAEPETALQLLKSQLVDLVIVEIALRRFDGIRVCQQIRELHPCMPLMILSELQDEDQIVQGLSTPCSGGPASTERVASWRKTSPSERFR